MRLISLGLTFLLTSISPVSSTANDVTRSTATAGPERLIACGWDNLSIFEVRFGSTEPVREAWFWKPQEYDGVPENVYDLYRHIDECKPFDGGEKILITASTDGVGLVDRRNRRFIHFGVARNAHSVELLPGGRIAVASSNGGDSLTVFDGRAGGQVLVRKPLPGGHGVYWDADGKQLYALSETAIEVFVLTDWDGDHPDLRHLRTVPLPEHEGHDFSPIPGTSRLNLTTATRTWTFDRADDRIAPHARFANETRVKAIASHASTGDIAWLKADPNGWWSYNIRFIHDGRALTAPVNKRYYKLRWIEGSARRWPDPR